MMINNTMVVLRRLTTKLCTHMCAWFQNHSYFVYHSSHYAHCPEGRGCSCNIQIWTKTACGMMKLNSTGFLAEGSEPIAIWVAHKAKDYAEKSAAQERMEQRHVAPTDRRRLDAVAMQSYSAARLSLPRAFEHRSSVVAEPAIDSALTWVLARLSAAHMHQSWLTLQEAADQVRRSQRGWRLHMTTTVEVHLGPVSGLDSRHRQQDKLLLTTWEVPCCGCYALKRHA